MAHTRQAIFAANKIREVGGVSYIPQLNILWELLTPYHYERWMEQSFQWIDRLDCVVRLPGESSGADRELEYARKNGKHVCSSLEVYLGEVKRFGIDIDVPEYLVDHPEEL